MNTRPNGTSPFWRTPSGLVLCAFLAVAVLFLVFEHGAHLLGAWPVLLLVLCFGMHLLMHGGHGGHSHGEHADRSEEDRDGR